MGGRGALVGDRVAADARSGDRALERAAALFAAVVLFHNVDHLRRGGDSVDADVFAVGTLAIVVEVALVVLVFARHRVAPLAAASLALPLALGYVLVHFTPDRSWLSDSFVDGGAAAVSVVAGALESLAAAALGAVGVVVLKRRGGLPSSSAGVPALRSTSATMRHPVVAVMAIGNVLILGGTLLTR